MSVDAEARERAALFDLRDTREALISAREQLRDGEARRQGFLRAIQNTSGDPSDDFEGCVL